MSSTELLEKFSRLERNISSEKGDFALFALFMREDVPDRWDLIVSAAWASQNQNTALEYVINKIKSDLSPQDLNQLARIVFIDPQDVAVGNLNRAIGVEHGQIEVRDRNFFGLPIKHAFIITSKGPGTAVSK